MNSLSVPPIHDELTIFSKIHYELTSSLFLLCINCDFAIIIVKSLWIFIVFANSLWIYYGYRPQMITILISRRNADSKLVNWIYFVSSARFPLFVKFDPISTSDDLWSPKLTLNNLEFEFFTKFWVETYVFCIQFD